VQCLSGLSRNLWEFNVNLTSQREISYRKQAISDPKDIERHLSSLYVCMYSIIARSGHCLYLFVFTASTHNRASTRVHALNRARNTSVDVPITRYLMLSKQALSQNIITRTLNDSNRTQKIEQVIKDKYIKQLYLLVYRLEPKLTSNAVQSILAMYECVV